MAERTLSTRALNRALLARQLLLERRRLPIARAVERIGGIQSQYAPSAYVGLWSRLEGFRRADLTRALERRRVVQGWLMRITIHIVSARDYWPLALAVREARRRLWLRNFRKELAGIDMARVAAWVRALLADGPLKALELQRLLQAEGYPRQAGLGAGLWVDLVRVPPSGTWEQRRADLYGLAEAWLGPPQPAGPDTLDLPDPSLPRGLRSGVAGRPAELVGASGNHPAARGLAPIPAPVSRRAWRGTPRSPWSAASAAEPAGAGAVPPVLRRHAPRARPAHADPAGAIPPAGVQHQDSPIGRHRPG